jgi:hypothetical protein
LDLFFKRTEEKEAVLVELVAGNIRERCVPITNESTAQQRSTYGTCYGMRTSPHPSGTCNAMLTSPRSGVSFDAVFALQVRADQFISNPAIGFIAVAVHIRARAHAASTARTRVGKASKRVGHPDSSR